MPAETDIQELTAAVRDLTAVLRKTAARDATTTSPEVVVPPANPKHAKAASTSIVTEAPPAVPVPADGVQVKSAPVLESAAPVLASVTYDHVKAAILKLSQIKDRQAAATLLNEFGAARGPDLAPEQYSTFVARAQAAMAA